MKDFGYENAGDLGGNDLTKAESNETLQRKCLQRCEYQEQTFMSSTSIYPNRQTFPYQDQFCIVMQKLATLVCKDKWKKLAFENKYHKDITCDDILKAYEEPTRHKEIFAFHIYLTHYLGMCVNKKD